jgi:hypothetical protein
MEIDGKKLQVWLLDQVTPNKKYQQAVYLYRTEKGFDIPVK